MNSAFFAFGNVSLSSYSLKRWLGIWIFSEIVIFLLSVKLIGAGATLILMLATSVLGVSALRRVGLGAAKHLRRHMAGGGTANEAFVDGSLTALGALMLVLPGFVSDAIGLALITPSIRQQLALRFLKPTTVARQTQSRRVQPDVIDLGPEDWRVVERSTRTP